MRRGKRICIIAASFPCFFFGFLNYSVAREPLYPGQIITIEGMGENTSGKNFSLITKFATTTVVTAQLKDYDKKILNLKDHPILRITGLVERKSNRYYIAPNSPDDIQIIERSTKYKTASRKKRDGAKNAKKSILDIHLNDMPKEIRLKSDSDWPRTKKFLIYGSIIETALALAMLLKYKKAY